MHDPKVIELDAHRQKPPERPEHLAFLLEEGLDVLAAYRQIADVKLRHTVRDLIFQIAQLSSYSPLKAP